MTATLESLDSIEQIKKLKSRYFRLLDTKQWDEWRTLFTDDLVFYFEEDVEPRATSADQFVDQVRRLLQNAVSVHHGHMPELDLISATEARGVWAMFDWVDAPEHGRHFQGFGHYHEKYRRGADGRWRIEQLHLSRIRVDPIPPRA